MAMAEQLEAHSSPARDTPGRGRFIKRETVRAERRAARRDPEDAPRRRRYRGWSG